MADDKTIRFIDSSYKELFRVQDGDKIVINGYDGTNYTGTCRYIDDYHFDLTLDGGYTNTYHICQFAEIRERRGDTYEPVYNSEYELGTISTDEETFSMPNADKTRGCIGTMRGEFGRDGDRFHANWENDTPEDVRTAELKSELNDVMNYFRNKSDTPFLKNRSEMEKACESQKPYKREKAWTDSYIFKVTTSKHTYYMTCYPKSDRVNFYIRCYDSKQLQRHMKKTNAPKKIKKPKHKDMER